MSTKYSDIVSLREQKAAYSITNEAQEDWKSFIANDQFNEILQTVIKSVRNNNTDFHKSFWIDGTYGTGKSHAGAVIKHLLCDDVTEIVDYVNEEYKEPRYSMLRNDILQLRNDKKLFPVTLYGVETITHEDDLSLVLQQRISSAIKKANLNIVVKTDFDTYIEHIKNDQLFWLNLIGTSPQLSAVAPTPDKLVDELSRYDISILNRLKNALREKQLSIRLRSENLAQWFFEVQKKLAEETEYCGLFIIWDEFTDVMQSPVGMRLLVKLQEINEKVMDSENNSYFFFISHPSAWNCITKDEQDKTKGRFHSMKYNMNAVSAFKIMSRKFKVENESEYQSITHHFFAGRFDLLDMYSNGSTNVEETKQDISKLFPLHPSTANLATYYASVVGSSSRSVFQFIGENPKIREFFEDEEIFKRNDAITADYLWDYVLEEFNNDVTRFGVVTERYNSRRLQIESLGEDYSSVFKGVLLLNALNNIANNVTVTPSEDNIANLFKGTSIENKIIAILDYFDENGIIQRLPGGLFSIQFSALPQNEIREIIEELKTSSSKYKYTYQVINTPDFRETINSFFFKNITRPYVFEIYSLDSNENYLLSRIDSAYKKTKTYELFFAFMVARNLTELNDLKAIAQKYASTDSRFKNVTFIVIDSQFGDKNYDRFIEYEANAVCANKRGLGDQYQQRKGAANELVKIWINEMRRSNFSYYLGSSQNSNASTRLSSVVNLYIAPAIFNKGPESLQNLVNCAKSFWKFGSAKTFVDIIMSFNTRSDISAKCIGVLAPFNGLLQDTVNEDLTWKDDVDKDHPLYNISNYVFKKLEQIDKNAQFNLGDKLIDLTKAPYGMYQTYSCMGIIAFAMRQYIKQIYDLNGKPREQQHLVDDIVEMFKAWDSGSSSSKLNFRFETKETRHLCDSLIKAFKLNELKGYNDISSLKDARWAITHEYSKTKGFPLWALKYYQGTTDQEIKTLVDNILQICEETDKQNPQTISQTLDLLTKYKFELNNLLMDSNSFKDGFVSFLKLNSTVNLQDDEVDEAFAYLTSHLEETIGLWTETEVANNLKDWRIEKNTPKTVVITGIASPIDGGKIFGDGKKNKGDSVSIVAFPNTGWEFVRWEETGVQEQKIETVAEFDITFTAIFRKIVVEPTQPTTTPPPPTQPKPSESNEAIDKINSISELTIAKDIIIKLIKLGNNDLIQYINNNL